MKAFASAVGVVLVAAPVLVALLIACVANPMSLVFAGTMLVGFILVEWGHKK